MIFAVLLGAIGGTGAALIASGWRQAPVRTVGDRWANLRLTVEPELVAFPLALGLGALVFTRWPAAAVLGVVVGRAVANRRRLQVDEAARAEGIALWIEQLKNAAGSADGVETVLGNAARHAPARIREDVRRGTARLAYEPLDEVLDDLSEALAHPSGDHVTRAMRQVAAEGGSLQAALDRLAKRTRKLADMHRRIEVAREQPRSTMRTVLVVIALFTVVLFVAARDWMSAYGTAVGQIVLLLVAAWLAFWYGYMARLARIDPLDRFYARRARP